MKIEQSAGSITLTSFADGYPIFTNIDFEGITVISHATVNDLHDMRYALDRQIAQIEQWQRK